MENKEPYRATRLWNEVIIAFQSGMPRKKHRRLMQTYDNCFTASDGITWLHCYLMNNPNFGPDVTRQQAIHLMQKFLKCHVIESITSKAKKLEFSDSSHLYRFTLISPQKTKILPLQLIQSPTYHRKKPIYCSPNNVFQEQKENLPECHFIEKKLSLVEIGIAWKTFVLSRLEKQLSSISIKDILDEKDVSGHIVKHNVSRISKTGVVCLIDKTDDIPHWVISAMKCLANWPNARGSGSCLPNYPGFEKDVFKVVRDFFINPQIPLIPVSLSAALLKVFSGNFTTDQHVSSCFSKSASASDDGVLATKLSTLSSASAVKTSTPIGDHNDSGICTANKMASQSSHEGKLLLDDPEVMWDYPTTVYFETDFATTDPITRMISDQYSLKTAINRSYVQCVGSIESISTISICSVNQNSHNAKNFVLSTPLKTWHSDLYLCNKSGSSDVSCHTYSCNYSQEQQICLKETDMNTSTASSKTLTNTEEKSLDHAEGNKNELQNNKSPLDKCHLSSSVFSQKKSSSLSFDGKHLNENYKEMGKVKFAYEIISPEELKSSFQLILLFLSPPSRRQLHLLLRVINKILKNGKFILDIDIPMRDYLLQTFLPAIVQSDLCENSYILTGMIAFLLDNCEIIFQPPHHLKEEVEEALKLRSGKIVYSVDDASYLTYCELVSKQQYEQQKISGSTEALKSLLENILQDKNLTEKERKRRLKQFKENHPEIYYLQFPEKQKQEPKIKKTFLNKLVNLRM